MRGRLPIATYLFILRKHLWLMLGTVVVVLAGGWYYARNQAPVYEADAVVQIQMRSPIKGLERGVLPVDPR